MKLFLKLNLHTSKRTKHFFFLFQYSKLFSIYFQFTSSGSGETYSQFTNFVENQNFINGLDEYELNINEHISLTESNIFDHKSYRDGNRTQLNFVNLRPGSVVAVR